MSNSIRPFGFDYDRFNGVKFTVLGEPILSFFLLEAEVDANVQILKEHIDNVASEMKAKLKEHRKQPKQFP